MSSASLYGGAVSYDSATLVYSVSTSVTTTDLNSLISVAEAGATLRFAEGTYVLTQPIIIKRGDLNLEGAGESQTIFRAEFSKAETIVYASGSQGLKTGITENVASGSHSVTVSDPALFAPGDTVSISQINDSAFLNQAIPTDLGSDHYMPSYVTSAILASGSLYGNIASDPMTASNPLRTTLTKIEAIEGNRLILKDGIVFDMTSGLASVQKINTLDNIHLSGFSLTNNLGDPNDASIKNEKPAWVLKDAIRIAYTDSTIIDHVSVINAPSNGLTMVGSYGAKIDYFSVDGSFNKGDGGNGYALNIAGTQASQFTNLTLTDTRHGVIFSSWGAEINNFVHVALTNRDINYHGGPDQGNIVIVDKSLLNTAATGVLNVGVVSSQGAIHPYTDISANSTLFTYAVGGKSSDVIHATDGGAYLSGGYQVDYLYGGAGDDVLRGGLHDDHLWGGAGADMFVSSIEAGGSLWGQIDRIYDFKADEGDQLVFFNPGKTYQISDVFMEALGNDTRVWVDKLLGSVLLINVTPDQIRAENIILNSLPFSESPEEYSYDYHNMLPPESLPLPPPDPDQIFKAVVQAESLKGGTGNDTVAASMSMTTGDFYDLDEGLDTLALSGEVWAQLPKLPSMSGVDVLDLSQATAVWRLGIDDAMVRQSDNGVLSIKTGSVNIQMLSTALKDASLSVVVEGEGDIFLADKVNNRVTIGDNNSGAIRGGTGNDIITAGSGIDTISGGMGRNVFILTPNVTDNPDVIKDFGLSKGNVLDLSRLIEGFDPLQDSIHDFLEIAKTASGDVLIRTDADGRGTEHFAQDAIVLEGIHNVDIAAMIVHRTLIV